MKERYLKIQDLANKIVERNGILFPPIPIETIVDEEIGFNVAETIFDDNKISGSIDFDQHLILVNKLDVTNRQRFTIAHELGHWFLHQDQIKKNADLVIFYRKVSYLDEIEPLEQEANYFAANLLVPNFIFKQFADRSSAILANIFKVSKNVIELRKINYKGK